MDRTSRAERFVGQALRSDPARLSEHLQQTHVVVGIPEALARTRVGQVGLVTATNILSRLGALAPHLYLDVPSGAEVLDGVPLLEPGLPLRDSLVALSRRLAMCQQGHVGRDALDPNRKYDFGLFLGKATTGASRAVVIGSNGWLATIRTDGKEEPVHIPDSNPMGMILAATLGATEIVKQMWLPVASPEVVIELIEGRTTLSAYDLTVDAANPPNPPLPEVLDLGHACCIGLGATGAGCMFVLGCLRGIRMSLDLVDMDRIAQTNTERLFTGADPATDIGQVKVEHAARFIGRMHTGVHAFAYPMPFERFVDRARDRLGYVWCCLDSARSRSVLQTELPSVIANGGTADSAWSLSLHEYDRPDCACLQDLYPDVPARPFDPIQEVIARLGIDPETARQLIRPNRPVDWRLLAGVIARENDPAKRQQLLALGGRRYQEVVAHICATMKPAPQAPAATISFVALMPSIAMVADLLKRRLYDWHPVGDEPNLFYFDTFRPPSRGRAMKAAAGRRCLCQMPHYGRAFAMRQALRGPYLGRTFESPAEEPTPHPQPSGLEPGGADKARGPAVQMTPPFARDHVRRGPPGAAAVKSRIGVAAFRTGARLLWLVALAVHLASFTASGLAIGAFLDPKNPLAAASRPLQLVGAAARAHPDGVSWLTYSGMSLVPVVIQWVALLLAVTMVGRGVRAYGRTLPPNADSRGLRWARRLPRFFGVTAVPAYWFGALTWLTITVRCLVPSLERLGCFPCALMPAGVFLIVTGLVQVTLLPGRLVRGLVGRWEQGTPLTGRAARAVRR